MTAAAVLRLLFAALIPAFPDETYYWDWSRHLAAGYFDHPPVIAWLISLGDALLAPFGAAATPLAVRLGPVVVSWIAAVATVGVARRIAGDAAAMRAAVIITVLPLAAAGLILATPDSPVLAATALGLYGVVRALQSPVRSAKSLRWWSITGLILGVAFSSKYTSIFLPAAVVIAIVVRPALRARLKEPGPYVACIIATIVFSPVLVWNAHHGWISFVYQVRHGLSAPAGSALLAAWKHEGDFFGGQAALASPILFVMLAIATGAALRRHASNERFILAVVALVSFGFFVYAAVRQRVEPNWPAPAYIPAIVLLATMQWTAKRARAAERWLNAGAVFGAAMSVLIYAQAVVPILPIPAPKDPIARAFGWDDLTARAELLARSASVETRSTTWLGGDRYQEASELAFHAASHPAPSAPRQTFSTNLSGRPNQYDLWPRFPDLARPGDNLVLAVDEGSEPHAAIKALAPYFASFRSGDLVALRRGDRAIGTRRLWLMVGWRGGWPPFPQRASASAPPASVSERFPSERQRALSQR